LVNASAEKVESFELQKTYREDMLFHSYVKKLLILAFISVLHMIRAFEFVADDYSADDEIDDLLDYFETNVDWSGKKVK
jgi:hypothetical protein